MIDGVANLKPNILCPEKILNAWYHIINIGNNNVIQ